MNKKQIIKLKFLNLIFLMIMAIIMFVCLFGEEILLALIIINIINGGWLGWVVLCFDFPAVIFIFKFIISYIRKKQDEMEKKIENENN